MIVVGVGDADVDIYLELDHLPGRDEKIIAKNVSYHPGGMTANFLVALAKLGTPSIFHGPLGPDQFGQMALEYMKQQGVDSCGVVIKPNGKTYFCSVLLDQSGEKALIVVPTDCLHLDPEQLSERVISMANHLHTTAVFEPTASRAIQLARKHGLSVSLDIEPNQLSGYDEIQHLLAYVDVLFVNHRAAIPLTKTTSYEESLKHLIERGVKIACITLGVKGSLVASKDKLLRIDSFPVKVVDTTGAGDCYAAAFIHGYLKGWPLEAISTYASAVGSLAVTYRGSTSKAPSHSDVLSFLEKRSENIQIP